MFLLLYSDREEIAIMRSVRKCDDRCTVTIIFLSLYITSALPAAVCYIFRIMYPVVRKMGKPFSNSFNCSDSFSQEPLLTTNPFKAH